MTEAARHQSGEAVWLPLLADAKVVAVTGGGGKTSLVYYLARMLRANGRNAVVSLTTKMFHPGSAHPVVFADSAASLAAFARGASGLTTIAAGFDSTDSRKLTGLPSEWFTSAIHNAPDAVFVLEADGSAGRSVKGYLPHEPVIPGAASLVIPVIGLDVLGKPLTEDFVHRAESVAALSAYPLGSIVTIDLIVRLLLSIQGYQKGCPKAARLVVYLNKAESTALFRAAESIAQEVLADCTTVQGVVAGSLWDDKFYFWPRTEN